MIGFIGVEVKSIFSFYGYKFCKKKKKERERRGNVLSTLYPSEIVVYYQSLVSELKFREINLLLWRIKLANKLVISCKLTPILTHQLDPKPLYIHIYRYIRSNG